MDFHNKLPAERFQSSLMFVGKVRAYLIEAPSALPTNIRPGWNGLPGTNTLAYYENP
jgi:hypothetical protein